MPSKQKQEAIERMKKLGIMPRVIDAFRRSDRLYYSERQNKVFNAVLYYVDNNPSWIKAIKEFEKRTGCLVYHCQLTHFEFGDCLSLLYVSDYEEDWQVERLELNDGYVMVKTYETYGDKVYEDMSDMGFIQVKASMGGITRIA